VRLRTVPVTFADAKAFVADWHRHHRPPVGHKYSIGVANDDDVLVAVAVVGRPVARLLDDGLTLPTTPDIRTCANGSSCVAGSVGGGSRLVLRSGPAGDDRSGVTAGR
jgi:hypothetical protein